MPRGPPVVKENLLAVPFPRRCRGIAPPLIDAGVVIPGMNDDFRGKAPDIGPEEVR